MSTSGATRVIEVEGDERRSYVVAPGDVGLELAAFEDVVGGSPEHNAQITRAVLAGRAGPPRDIAVLNAGAAIYAGGRAGSIADGVEIAQRTIDSGAAAAALERYVALTRELGEHP
jgi:anthranilate phosphoribosyltransferase